MHHKAQINCVCIYDDLILCGSDDAQIRAFRIEFSESEKHFDDGADLKLEYLGTINRSGTDKTTFLATHKNILFAHGIKDIIDVWQFNNQEEIKKRLKKRHKKVII